MSTTIDERVVEMRFDNAEFEKRVKTSLNSIERLKNGLNLDESAKSLESINRATKNFSMDGLASGVETVRLKFSALEVMAFTVLQNITNSALSAGQRIASALTIDPIRTGFQEYETQINAVQTILANTKSKGSTLEDVNDALDVLNTYADKTIYNFTEMTRNIGTFTAAGVDLNTSVSAIKGIANLAAVSGSTSQQASTAMYQLSQALASGTVKLMDWNSVVNAGMGGQVFQDALKETARLHGIAIDDMIASEGSFRETLKDGWLTSAVLTETLAKFTGDLSKEQLVAMGYTEEQIAGIIELGKTANDAATKVKTFTQLFDTLQEAAQSGWTQTWETIVGDFEEAKALLTDLSKIFGGIIEATSQKRIDLFAGWKDMGGRLELIEAVKNGFNAIASVVIPIKEAFEEIFPPTTSKQLYNLTVGLKEFLKGLQLTKTQSEDLKRTFKGLFSILDIVKQVFSALWRTIRPLLGGVSDLRGGLLGLTATIGDWLVNLNEAIKKHDVFYKAMQIVGTAVESLVGFLGLGTSAIAEFFKNFKMELKLPGIEVIHNLLERLHVRLSQLGAISADTSNIVIGAFSAMGRALANSSLFSLFESLWHVVTTISKGIAQALSGAISGISDRLQNANFSNIIDVINSISLGGIALAISKFLSNISKPLEGVKSLKESVLGILDGVRGCFEAYQTQLKAGALLKIAGAIAVLAASIVAISLIDSTKLTMSLGSITALFGELLGSLAIFNTISASTGSTIKGTTAMIAISTSILILAGAMKRLETMSWEGIAKSVAAVGVLLAELSIFISKTKFSGKIVSTSIGLTILSGAIVILASACKKFEAVSWEGIGKGLTSIGAILAEFAIFTKLTGNAKKVISTGTSLILIATSMNIFAAAISKFANMSWGELGIGLTAMAGALAEVAIATRVMPKNMVGIGSGLIVVGAALNILSSALSKMGSMSWDEIGKSLVVMGGALAELAIALNFMKGTIGGSAALLLAASALAILTPVLSILGAMPWGGIVKGLVSIAGTFAIIGVAGALLTPIIPTMLAFAGAITLVGVGMTGIGVGVLALGVGLQALALAFTGLAAAGTAGATAVVAALTVIITGLAGMIPAIMTQIANGIVLFAQAIIAGGPIIVQAIITIIDAFVTAISSCIPKVANSLVSLLTSLLTIIAQYTPRITQAVLDILVSLLDGIARNIGRIIQAGVDIVVAFVTGIGQAVPQLVTAGYQMIIDFINGLAESIRTNTPTLVSAMDNLIDALIEAAVKILTGGVDTFVDAGVDLVTGLIKGISSCIGNVIEAAKEIGSSAIEGLKNILDIHSPSKVMELLGYYSGEGYANGLEDSSVLAVQVAENMANKTVKATQKGSDKILSMQKVAANKAKKLRKETNEDEIRMTQVTHDEMESEYEDYWSKLLGVNEEGNEGLTTIQNEMVATTQKSNQAISTSNKKAATEQKDLLKETMDVWKTYTDQLQQKTNSIMGQINLFSEVTHKGTADKDKLTKNLQEQVKEYESFGYLMITLNDRISSDQLKNAINEMGIDSIAELRALNAMTDDELTHYAELYEQKYALARASATEQLTTLKNDTSLKLSNLFGGVEVDVDTFGQMFNGTLESIESFIEVAKNTGAEIANGVGVGITENTAASDAATAMIDSAEQAAIEAAEIHSPSELFRREVGAYITDGMALGMTDREPAVQNASRQLTAGAVMALRSAYTAFQLAGQNAADGFRIGLLNKINEVASAAGEIANAAFAAAQTAIDSHSPSRKFMMLGEFADEGFAIGLKNYAGMVSGASSDVGQTALSSISSAISRVSDIVADGIDTEPSIKPVLDLSNIQNGTKKISSMFSANKAISIGADMRAREERLHGDNSGSNGSTGGNTYQMIQNNYSPKALSRIDIYRQTKNQFSTLKGVVANT